MEKYDIIIIGAGPAGLTAALYASRAGHKVLVLEGKAVGGQIINSIKVKNYPAILEISGADFAKNLKKQVNNYGGVIKLEKVVAISDNPKWVVKTDMEKEYSASAIILATGSVPRPLGLDNEDKFVGRGVSYCATCDGNFYKDKVIAVEGGGNTALYDALYLADLAKKVYLIHRRDEFRGDKALVEQLAKKDNVGLILSAQVTSLIGDDHLEKIVLDNDRELEVSGLFVAIGYKPQNEIFNDVVELDENGYVKTRDGVHTSAEKIYVAGDARKKELRQLTTAVSDGAIAATTAIQEM